MSEVLPEDKDAEVAALQRAACPSRWSVTVSTTRPPSLAADVGIAIGAGTDVAIESADVRARLERPPWRRLRDPSLRCELPQDGPEPRLGCRIQRARHPARGWRLRLGRYHTRTRSWCGADEPLDHRCRRRTHNSSEGSTFASERESAHPPLHPTRRSSPRVVAAQLGSGPQEASRCADDDEASDVRLEEFPWPVADDLDRVGLDELGPDPVVVVAVELVLVAPRVDEIERPTHVEVDEIGEHETLAARTVDPAGQRHVRTT